MEWTPTLQEDVISNLLLGLGMVAYFGLRDLCKRVSHSTCKYNGENGLIFALPTWRKDDDDDDEEGNELV
jgi:hypothetical protein